jgi:hypothetical protein
MKKVLSTVIALMLFIPQVVFSQTVPSSSSSGVNVSVTTEQGSYNVGTLTSNPIVVNVFVENNSDEWLVLSEDYRKLNTFAQFANLNIGPAPKYGQTSPCPTCTAVKGLAFNATPLPAYQNVFTSDAISIFSKLVNGTSVNVTGIYIGPHTKQMVARAEVGASDFLASPVPGGYKVRVGFLLKTIWNRNTQVDLPGSPGTPFEAITFIRLK